MQERGGQEEKLRERSITARMSLCVCVCACVYVCVWCRLVELGVSIHLVVVPRCGASLW